MAAFALIPSLTHSYNDDDDDEYSDDGEQEDYNNLTSGRLAFASILSSIQTITTHS